VDSIRREAHGHFEGKNNLIYSKNLEKLIPGTSDLRKTRKENKNLKDNLLKLEKSLEWIKTKCYDWFKLPDLQQ
jgi:hypothetical protein